MAGELRKTGIPFVGDLPWGTHFCYFYETRQDLFDALVPYCQAGLQAHERCLWVASEPLADAGIRAMRQAMPELDRHVAEGSLGIVEGGQWYLAEGGLDLAQVERALSDALDRALAGGYAGLRVAANPTRTDMKRRGRVSGFEADLDRSLAGRRMLVLCSYPLGMSQAVDILDAARTHQFAIARRHGTWQLVEAPRLAQTKAALDLERRRAEDVLRETELRYRTLVESVGAIVWRGDARTLQYTFVSHEAEALLGYPVAQWLEEPEFWKEHIHPADRDWVSAFCAKAVTEQRAHEFEYRMIAADGRVVWLRDVVRVVVEDGAPVELVGVMVDVTERRRGEDEVERSRAQLRALSRRLQEALEAERAAISRELHDEMGQMLTALKMDLGWLKEHFSVPRRRVAREAVLRRLRDMVVLVGSAIGRVRRLSGELRPGVLDQLGLSAAIEWQATEFQRRTGIRCLVRSTVAGHELDRRVATGVFRVFQEALTNVARHASARAVRVRLTEGRGRLILTVKDDGKGIRPDEASSPGALGLLGMRERAQLMEGEVTVEGVPGRGTTVTLSIPVAAALPTPASDAARAHR